MNFKACTLFVVSMVFVLAACQNGAQIEEPASTLEAEAKATLQPASSPTALEPTAEEQPEEEEAQVAPIPSRVPTAEVTDVEEFVSATEFFSVKVPVGWRSEETVPGGAFIMANTEAALERYRSGTAFKPGDFVLNVGFLPYRLLQSNELRSLDFQFDAPPDVFLQSLLPMFHTPGDAVMSDVELVSLGDERDAGMLTVSEEAREGLILMFVAGDSVVAFVSTVASPGEMGDFQELTYIVAASVTFSGAQDALFGTLLGG